MSNLVEFHDAFVAHMGTWTDAPVVMDGDYRKTKGVYEYVAAQVDGGVSVIGRRTGLLDIRGTEIRHPILLTFSVFTDAAQDVKRNYQLCQSVIDHWQAMLLTPRIHFLAPEFGRVGLDGDRYQSIVRVSGHRDELRNTA